MPLSMRSLNKPPNQMPCLELSWNAGCYMETQLKGVNNMSVIKNAFRTLFMPPYNDKF